MSYNVLTKFTDKAEADRFIKHGEDYYKKKDGYHFDYTRPAKDNFKDFLYVIWWLAIITLIVWLCYLWFSSKSFINRPNITNVVLDQQELPAIWEKVYFYGWDMKIYNDRTLNQIRIDSDWVVKYNICLTDYINNCFDTLYVATTEQWLKEWLCK